MKYDDLVEHLGELGPYQKRIYFLACLPCITAAIHALTPVFILAVPDHRCAIPGLANDTYKVQSSAHQSLIDYTLPKKKDGEDDDGHSVWGKAECDVFRGRSADNFINSSSMMGDNSTTSCHRWVYDKEVFDDSFVTQEDLVCEDKVLRSHANMIFMCGLLFGSFFFGSVSDRLGRKTAIVSACALNTVSTITLYVANNFICICICIWLGRKTAFLSACAVISVSSISLSFANNFVFFVVLRFMIGASTMGIGLCCLVLGMELLGRKYRAQAGIIVQFFWCFGMFVLNLLAYFIRDWKTLQLAVSCYTVLFLFLYWLVPESPRWQISQGHIEKARVTMEKIAKANGKELPKDAFTDNEDKAVSAPKGKMSDIFSSPVLMTRVVVVFINWLVVTMVYYGLTLNVGSLGGSIYVNFAFSGAVEFLGNVATLFALPVVGRKKFHCFSMLLGGFACLASMIPALINTDVDPWVNIMLSNIGKFGATGGFSTIYVFTAELFPTFMRNSIVGYSSMVARLGGIAAPYIADLGTLVGGKFGTALPYVVFGACSVLAGLLALTLPETLNVGSPETIEEAIHFGKNKPNNTGTEETKESKYTVNGKDEINLGYVESE